MTEEENDGYNNNLADPTFQELLEKKVGASVASEKQFISDDIDSLNEHDLFNNTVSQLGHI